MIVVEICIGSSCFIRGSEELVQKFQKAVEERHLDNEIVLTGSFCSGKCNREGVTIAVDGKQYTGVTPESFETFFEKNVLSAIK